MPEVIPYLFYRDVPAALDWLSRAFGFVEEMRHKTPSGMHAQMLFEGQRIMMGQGAAGWRMLPPLTGTASAGIFVYLDEVDAHHAQAAAAGAEIVEAPHDKDYGRTYTVRDLDGHPWFFTKPPSARTAG